MPICTQLLADGRRGKDLRASRAAAEDHSPHYGTAKAIGLVIPETERQTKGHATRAGENRFGH
ncbi:hypothetical protein ACLK1S_08865 [Escherichia coli]